MPARPIPGEPVGRDLQAELDAERTAAEHWRRVARQRSADFAELRHRPTVRAFLAAERRLEPLRTPIARAAARMRARADRFALSVSSLGRSSHGRLDGLATNVGRLPVPETREGQRIALVVVGASELGNPGSVAPGLDVDVVVVEPSRETVAEVSLAMDSTDHDLVGIVLGTSEPLDPSWLTHLAAAIGDGVVAATPVLVHPERSRDRATPHDGRVRSVGLSLDVTPAGVPIVRAGDAGIDPDPGRAPVEVDAGSVACLLFDRAAFEAAGGIPVVDDLDVAAVELCVRLRSRGGRIVAVPSAMTIDHRPVRSRRDLRAPIDPAGRAWRGAIDRSGPLLWRSAWSSARSGNEEHGLRFIVTVAAPSAKVAPRWGDWHLAEGIAGGLRRLGHEVAVQTADRAEDPAGRVADLHLVLRGLAPVRRSPGQRHVLWIISHPESIEDEELGAADLVLVASAQFADHLRTRTTTPVEVFLQATDHHRFSPRPVDPAYRHEITVVAKTRDVLRPVVADAISVGLRPAIYGGGWRALVDPDLVVADHLDNKIVPCVYSSAGVVLNDHWRTMQTWGFVSNRLYDVLACGAPVISDPVAGIAEVFDGGVLEYDSPAELRRLVDEVLADPAAARLRAQRGRAAVLAGHTFDHRAQQLMTLLARNAKNA